MTGGPTTPTVPDDVASASDALLDALAPLRCEGVWMTASEMGGPSAAALTAMCRRSPTWLERRIARWGGESGQRHGRGYEYRLTQRGAAAREHAAVVHAAATARRPEPEMEP